MLAPNSLTLERPSHVRRDPQALARHLGHHVVQEVLGRLHLQRGGLAVHDAHQRLAPAHVAVDDVRHRRRDLARLLVGRYARDAREQEQQEGRVLARCGGLE